MHVSWAEVYRLSAAQGVAAIAWDGLQRLIAEGVISPEQAPDRATKLQWALSTERCEKRYRRQTEVIGRLAEIYATADIRMMMLKGYGISLCYPRPEHRSCSDIDIWLFGEQRRADELLRRELGIAIDEDKHHHTTFVFNNVMVENHYDFLNVHAHASNREIERHLKGLAPQAIAIEVMGQRVYLPNANCHALFLIRHAAAHFAAVEIVLRHVIDWGQFVKHHHADIDWAWLRQVCQEHNMECFLDVMNVLAADICGMELALMPATQRNALLEQRVLNDILSPEFAEQKPSSGVLRIVGFKLRRWWANRWKHRMVYRDSLILSFITHSWSHILKPKGIRS